MNNPKKIAILAAYPVHLLPGYEDRKPRGHFATWLPQLCENFEAYAGLDIHWVVMTPELTSEKVISHRGQSFHLLPRSRHGISIITFFLRDRFLIGRVLKALSPDLVHAWGTEDVYGAAQADWPGVSVISMQGMLWHYWTISKESRYMFFTSRLEKWVLKRSHNVTSESPWGRDRVLELNPQADVRLVEYGVPSDFFPHKRKLCPEPHFIYVGSVDYRKGADILLQAFSDPRLENVKLTILGGGPLAGELESLGNVEFLGRVPKEKVAELYSVSWALIHPTRADTSPNSVKEARISGVAIITTECGGQAQYIEEGKSGLIFDVNQPEELIGHILALAGDRDRCQEMGIYNIETYREALAASLTAEKFHALYLELLGTGKNSY
ncbi:MAG: glycosyltransferase family 4 protein [Akkermansiaceae bacterium]